MSAKVDVDAVLDRVLGVLDDENVRTIVNTTTQQITMGWYLGRHLNRALQVPGKIYRGEPLDKRDAKAARAVVQYVPYFVSAGIESAKHTVRRMNAAAEGLRQSETNAKPSTTSEQRIRNFYEQIDSLRTQCQTGS